MTERGTYHLPKHYRKFGGKLYELHISDTSKSGAQATAKRLRREGVNARVVYTGAPYYYRIYVRRQIGGRK